MQLGIDETDLASCVSCGLCLPHCPTYRVTGEEALSPRGRIAAMRQVQRDGASVDDAFVHSMETCVQCRGCEPACPSGVPFGRMMERTRHTLGQPAWRRIGFGLLEHDDALRGMSSAVGVAQRTGLVPSTRLGLPERLPVRRPTLEASGSDVWLFTGCVMDAWQRDVHVAVKRVLEATGVGVGLIEGLCCGALSTHAGLAEQADRMAERVMAAAPDAGPILVDSAGCGAELKAYPDAAFAERVLDVHEWLADRIDTLPPPRHGAPRRAVAIQDACHLRHVQRAHASVRTVLAPYYDVVELDDEGLCCGAGGAYAVMQPGLANDIRARKVAAVERSGAPIVASANPGCMVHLRNAGLDVRYPVELVHEAIRGG